MKKKIAYVIYDINKIGGAEKISTFTANKLCEWFDVSIISINSINNCPYVLDDRISLKSMDLNFDRMFKNCFNGFFTLKQILKKEKIDTLLLVGTNTSLLSILTLFTKHCKIIFCDHESLKATLDDKKATIVRKISLKFSSLVVALTKKNMDDYVTYLKANKNKLTYIYNPIDISSLKKYKSNYCPNNKLVTVGRLSKEKGLDILIEVAKELKKINNNWQWDIWGDGDLYQDVLMKIQENNLEDKIFLKGNNPNVIQEYKNYGIYVLTSYREGLPLVLLEAKANEIPIVSFDIDTGPNEIVRNNINGFLISAFDVKDMANKINMLLTDSHLCESFSKNAYLDIEKFSVDNILKQWVDIINN